MAALEAASRDPRAQFRWRELDQQAQVSRFAAAQRQLRSLLMFRMPGSPGRFPVPPGRFPNRNSSSGHTDWNISLGSGTTPAGMFPAKYSFDTAATPSCANDFVVFPVNANGSATQPNLVAFNNLYSGTAGGNGICNRNNQPNDDDVSATVFWSYNIEGLASGTVATSLSLSLDGTKVAFVETATGSPAHFHVLAWKSLDGTATNRQSVTSPKTINTFVSTAPSSGSGTATDLALGSSTTGTITRSSPFIDYVRDQAYVGNDIGVLYRMKNVFCTQPTCSGALPSLDSTWGTSGAVTVPCAAKLTGPVVDFVTLNVFVGCTDGKVYGFNSSGTPLATPSIAVGNGSATGGVVETPVVDGVNGLIYAASGTGAAPNTTRAVVVQATTSLGGPCTGGTLCIATFGVSGVFSTHSPAVNDAYFTSGTSTSWMLYELAYSSNADLTIYGTTFTPTRTLKTGAASNSVNFGTHLGEYAPLTEFKNGGTDQLFFGILHTPVLNINTLGVLSINSFPAAPTTGKSVGAGPSGMTIDNVSTSLHASSIYFATQGTTGQGGNIAMKLTQSALN